MKPFPPSVRNAMKRLSICLVLAIPCDLQAQTPPTSALILETKKPVMLHENVTIRATGGMKDEILSEWNKAAGRDLTLLLNGIRLPGLESSVWLDGEGEKDVVLQFNLMRHPDSDDSRRAWDLLLNTAPEHLIYSTNVALAIGAHPPHAVPGKLQIGLAKASSVYRNITLCGIGFLLLVVIMGKNSNILRDGGATNAPFSLGRTQMVFWGLLVFFAWVGVSFTTGAMEHVPAGVLALIGISSTTGLSALVISNSQQSAERIRQETITRRNSLQTQMAKKAETNTQENADLLQQLNHEIATFPVPKVGAARPKNAPGRFFHDLCSDQSGLSFQRLQVVLWTMALGGFFAWRVVDTLSLPVIPENLLLLMGISNGTYIGFKIPEKG